MSNYLHVRVWGNNVKTTRGPYVNLVPQIEEILTTVMFE
jgi:hypothetical protein